MFRRRRWIVLLVGLLVAACWPLAVAAQSPDRLVLAFYYTWFDENSWGAGKVPDQPLAPYVSRDRGVMVRHIEQAKAAGIDALVVSWYGPRVQDNQTETNFRVMLDEAAARGFRLAVDFEVTSPFIGGPGDAQAALKTLLETHARHPAYLRSGGKPVIFFWRQQRFDVSTWAAIRQAVDPNHASLWIEEGVDTAPLSVFDGHHLYSVTWNPPTDLSYTANKFARFVRNYAVQAGAAKVYVATVMPGYDDRTTGRGDAFAVGREDGAYYARSWQAAIGSAPDWIVITSFNEWPEGSYIEPSQAFGNRYLELTAQWSAAFRGSAPLPPTPAIQPPPRTVPTPTPTPRPRPRGRDRWMAL
ncbi:MAG: endo-1,3-alpha-glucanase family glycosylhydrolase [Chloroflexi bacterium]|nr:endo-1,3-alpha-glucanase family glycosylhydrolase [Chloroflexota bacterium]